MIPVEQIYDSLLTLIREDKRGLALSPDEYNRIASLINDDLFNKEYAQYETTLKIGNTLMPFLEGANLNIIANSITLPSDYKIMIGKPYSITAGRYLDYATKLELHERVEDYLTKPTTTYPLWINLGEAGGYKIAMIYPATITGIISIDYLREPAVPFYDYYINDTTLVVTYMDAGTTVTIPIGCTYRDGTAGDGATTFASTSVDWEWDGDEMGVIINMLTSALGVAMPDQFLFEAGNLQEAKTE